MRCRFAAPRPDPLVLSLLLGDGALPLGENPLDVATLALRKSRAGDEAPDLGDVPRLDRGLEVLPLRRRLPELTADPAAQADRSLVELGHAARLDDRDTKATTGGPATLAP